MLLKLVISILLFSSCINNAAHTLKRPFKDNNNSAPLKYSRTTPAAEATSASSYAGNGRVNDTPAPATAKVCTTTDLLPKILGFLPTEDAKKAYEASRDFAQVRYKKTLRVINLNPATFRRIAHQRASLQELDLDNTAATAEHVSTFVRKCPALKTLNLECCRGAARGFISLASGSLPFLQNINLTGTAATAQQVSAIALTCPNLKRLNLGNCRNATAGFLSLGENALLLLEHLDLWNTAVTPEEIRAIAAACPSLKSLNINYCVGAAAGFISLPEQSLPFLENLNLWNTAATIEQIRAIARACPALKTLNLKCCPNAATALVTLPPGSFPLLENLNLSFTSATSAEVRTIIDTWPHLKSLILFDCPDAAAGFIGLAQDCLPLLENLDLSGTRATAEQVRAVIKACPSLKTLSLESCHGSAGGFIGLAQNSLPSLENLDLWNTAATPEQIRAIAQACPSLKNLSLKCCRDVAAGFMGLEQSSLPFLENLDLWNTAATAEQVTAIARVCPYLKNLSLESCPGSAAGLASLPEGSWPFLEYLNLSHTAATILLPLLTARFPKASISL